MSIYVLGSEVLNQKILGITTLSNLVISGFFFLPTNVGVNLNFLCFKWVPATDLTYLFSEKILFCPSNHLPLYSCQGIQSGNTAMNLNLLLTPYGRIRPHDLAVGL